MLIPANSTFETSSFATRQLYIITLVVGIVTVLQAGRYGVRFPAGTTDFSSKLAWGATQPSLDWVIGLSYPGGKVAWA
jgi:hypothetical protein